MKIAVTTDGTQIFQHFGKGPFFTLYTVDGGVIRGKRTIDASQNGHAALTGFLKREGTDTVICGGIGEGAKQMLSASGIRLISGISGNIDEAVRAFLSGELKDQGGACNHEKNENHTCDCKSHCGSGE